MPNKPFSWKARGQSFGYAWQGLKALFRTEHNAWIHAVLTLIVVVHGVWLGVSRTEAALLLLAAAFVWSAEIFNTAVEKLADVVSPQHHPGIKLVKDLAAAAVLVAAIAALVIGVLVFLPKFLNHV